MKVVIVGGVAGGATAAARLRRLDEHAEIIVFERTEYVSYANCGLPYYVGGVIGEQSELTLQTPESLWTRFRIRVMVRHEVKAINPDSKTVTVRNLETGAEWDEPYDKLLLSTGAKPVIPDIDGIGSDGIFTLRTVEDAVRIESHVTANMPKSAIIAGGGYIGIEMAENLTKRGIKVILVQRPDQLMGTLDYDMASFVHVKMRQNGIDLRLNSSLAGLEEKDGRLEALLGCGERISADMAILAVGVTPDSDLAKNAGLELGIKGCIAVNERMETSVRDIYAVGDAVQVRHFVTGEPASIALAGPANKQGRIAADNICGGDSRFDGSQGTSVIKIFDMTAANTGITEREAARLGLDYESVVLSAGSHAGYYPSAKIMTIKVVYEKRTMRLLGAQIVGADGVDKRIDVIAVAIRAGIRADMLKDLELAYAPPYSSAKDPVNMAGFIIDNITKGVVKQYHWQDVAGLPRDGSVTLLDTRTAGEYGRGHIQGYINIPVDELRNRLNEMDRSKPVYVMCQSGIRSYIASRILSQNGFDCYNFAGGYRFYASVISEVRAKDEAYPCGMDK